MNKKSQQDTVEQLREQPSLSVSQSVLKFSSFVLLALLGGVLFFVVSILADVSSDKQMPQAVRGQIDLSGISLSAERSISLDGEWQFYWQELLLFNQLSNESTAVNTHQAFIDVNKSWSDQTLNGEALPSFGAATYRVNIQLDRQYQNLAIQMPRLGSAYKLFINDELIVSAGEVALDAQSARSEFGPGIFEFTPPADNFDIVIQISNFESYWGGFWDAPRISKQSILNTEFNKQLLQSAFLLSVFFVVCAFNLMQFSLKPNNLIPLIVAIGCLLLAVREMQNAQILEQLGLLSLSFKINMQINFLSFYLLSLFMMIYYYKYLDGILNRKVIIVISIIITVFSVHVILAPVYAFNIRLSSFHIFILLCMFYCLYGLIVATRRKQKGAMILTVGTLVVFITVVNDMLYLSSIIDTVALSSFGLVYYAMCQNYLTYTFFIEASEQNKVLNKALSSRNTQLEELSNSLEQKVSSRTSALATAKEKLEALANQDPLTGIPNRRYLMNQLLHAGDALAKSQQPFCIAMIDFDHFKQINDTLGHERGDFTLKQGAQLMQSKLRDSDVLGRWGGEEFILLANDTDIVGIQAVAQKLIKVVQNELSEKLGHNVSVTIGIAQCGLDESLDDCLKRADDALYEGKGAGRNQIVAAKTHI